jgi:hypothetical protein
LGSAIFKQPQAGAQVNPESGLHVFVRSERAPQFGPKSVRGGRGGVHGVVMLH